MRKDLRCCAFLCVLFLKRVLDDVFLRPFFEDNAAAISRSGTMGHTLVETENQAYGHKSTTSVKLEDGEKWAWPRRSRGVSVK